MEDPKDETGTDDLESSAGDDDEKKPPRDDAPPEASPGAPKKPKDPEAGGEDSYEDGWYQVLKRRAGEAGDQEG